MLTLIFITAYLCGFSFVLGLIPVGEARPTLKGFTAPSSADKKKKSVLAVIFEKVALFNRPLCIGGVRQRMVRDLTIGHVNITPEQFMMIKELSIAAVLLITFPSVTPDGIFGWLCIGIAAGYLIPEIWLKGKIRSVKDTIIRELPDAIDLLALCVNAGLDFMLSLKWVVEKSPPSVMMDELNTVLQEINVGKTRRDALRDLAKRYELPDLSTFTRTLIQADRMGTSMSDALNILSEDMRVARYRRGEQLALKAPLKMLVPLLLFIFPVVAILVAGPIFVDFIENNPFQGLAK